jgi:hypothetical protein
MDSGGSSSSSNRRKRINVKLKELEWMWGRFIRLKTGTTTGCCERGYEPSYSMNDGEFIDWLSDW